METMQIIQKKEYEEIVTEYNLFGKINLFTTARIKGQPFKPWKDLFITIVWILLILFILITLTKPANALFTRETACEKWAQQFNETIITEYNSCYNHPFWNQTTTNTNGDQIDRQYTDDEIQTLKQDLENKIANINTATLGPLGYYTRSEIDSKLTALTTKTDTDKLLLETKDTIIKNEITSDIDNKLRSFSNQNLTPEQQKKINDAITEEKAKDLLENEMSDFRESIEDDLNNNQPNQQVQRTNNPSIITWIIIAAVAYFLYTEHKKTTQPQLANTLGGYTPEHQKTENILADYRQTNLDLQSEIAKLKADRDHAKQQLRTQEQIHAGVQQPTIDGQPDIKNPK